MKVGEQGSTRPGSWKNTKNATRVGVGKKKHEETTQNATRVIYCFLRKSDSKYVFCDLLLLNTSSSHPHKTHNNTTPPHAHAKTADDSTR